MTNHPTRRMRNEIRQSMHPVPPRLERATAKKMRPVQKPKRKLEKITLTHKPQSYSAQQRKDYQLGSKHH